MRPDVLLEITFAFVAIFVVAGVSNGEPAPQQMTKADVVIADVDLKSRTIEVDHNGKLSRLDLSRRTKVTIKGEPAGLDELIPGDEATVEYHKEFAIVTSINANGSVTQKWKFYPELFTNFLGKEKAIA